MDPGTLSLIGLGLGAASSAASLLAPKPKAPQAPLPPATPAPDDSTTTPKTSFLSNAAAAATPSQTSGKTLLGQ